MNNNNSESFPEDLRLLTERSYEIAEFLIEKLNEFNCPTLKDFYKIEKDKVLTNLYFFKQHGYGVNSNSLKGLYVFGEQHNGTVKPVYIGISRDVYRRLKQHGWGKTHNTATLAYLIADKKFRNAFKLPGQPFDFNVVSKNKRKDISNNADVQKAINFVKQYKAAIFEIDCDYKLYFHEVAIAGILKTKWNRFRTH
jgi:hypothetical protein